MRKVLSGGLLASYLMILIWLVLFKFSYDISTVLEYNHRSLNLIPFAASSKSHGGFNYGEIILNCIFFIPFGLLLNVNFKKPGFLPKLAIIVGFSLVVELIQYILAIGASDITDLITNSVGGILGLKLYDLLNKYIRTEKLDRVIIAVGILLLVLVLTIRIKFLHFRY